MPEQKEETLPELKKHRYGVAEVGKRADEYAQTTKAIAEHVGRVHGHEMKQLVLKGEESKFKEPEYPDAKTSGDIDRDRAIWSKQYDMYLKKDEKYKEQKAKVFSLIIGQCEKAVKNHVENDSGYEKAENENDVVALLQMIKNVAYNANVRKYPAEQATMAWKNLVTVRQEDTEDITDYYKRFTSLVELVESAYGTIAPEEIAKKNSNYNKNKSRTLDIERGKFLAYMFLNGADHKRSGFIMNTLRKDHALGNELYPETVEDALQVLLLQAERATKGKKQNDDDVPNLSFAQAGETGPKCWKCGKRGHVKKSCPDRQEEETKTTEEGRQFVSWAA